MRLCPLNTLNIHFCFKQLLRNHLLDYGLVIMDRDCNDVLHLLNKKMYQDLLQHDGVELRFLKLNWQHLEVVGSDRKVLYVYLH